MFLLLFLLFTTIPVLELMLLFRVGSLIGPLPTIAIVILTGIVGAHLARSQGRQILVEIQQRLAKGEVPEYQMLAGLMVFVGGVLLLTPGFATDAMGLLMIFPGTRYLIINYLRGQLAQSAASGRVHVHVQRDWGHEAPQRPESPQGGRIIDVKKVED